MPLHRCLRSKTRAAPAQSPRALRMASTSPSSWMATGAGPPPAGSPASPATGAAPTRGGGAAAAGGALARGGGEACGEPGGAPDVDLLIRTGGEQRLSDFLLWECAYAELYFAGRIWPEFNGRELAAAVRAFAARERRFGGV